jgi:hypothetical protein
MPTIRSCCFSFSVTTDLFLLRNSINAPITSRARHKSADNTPIPAFAPVDRLFAGAVTVIVAMDDLFVEFVRVELVLVEVAETPKVGVSPALIELKKAASEL